VAAFVYNHVRMRRLLRPAVLLLAVSVTAAPEARAQAAAPRTPTPVILDTDIGDDIDDTWALILALKSPELDVRLVVTDFGNTEYRAKIVARVLEVAGRTDVPIGIGIKENDHEGGQAEWVRGYDLAKYPGRVHRDGVQALVDTVMAAQEPMTLVAIGPPPNLKAALEREPRIAGKLRLTGMFGSLRKGYGGKPAPDAEWNVKARPAAARALLGAPWKEALLTPLDTCGLVQLKGERYARVRDSKDPLLQALVDNYRVWCRHSDWCARDGEYVTTKSSTLFDPVAVYLAISSDLVKMETAGVRVTKGGMTVKDPASPPLSWATEWKDLDGFEEWLTARLTAPASPR
jgi:inosine-uridine nucleoside N-ribohydrolase